MSFRRFQDDFNDLIDLKINQKLGRVKNILAYITPGGGKSLLPAILSKYAHSLNGKLCWVVPRRKLMKQGARDFKATWAYRLVGHSGELREAQNDSNPTRGNIGYITTYQAIGQDPGLHRDEFKRHEYTLFLDEIHHVCEGSNWHEALKPMVRRATFRVFATGSIDRGDRDRIAFLPYSMQQREGGYVIDTNERKDWRRIDYSRSEAISDGSILPLNFRILDGTAEWIDKDGRERVTDSLAHLSEEDARGALNTFLRTDAAKEIIDSAVTDWQSTRDQYSPARLLVAAPDRKHAKQYRDYISENYECDVGLAITDDDGRNDKALKEIDRFDPDEDRKPDKEVLVTVAMAYEGMSVTPITHVVCLTQYRTKSWLKQLFDRANRTDDGKPQPVIYGPDDPFFERCRKKIEKEQERAVPPEKMWDEEVNENDEDGHEDKRTDMWGSDSIVPLASSVLRERGIFDGDEFGYGQIAAIKEQMEDLGMEEENPAKVAALLDKLGFDIGGLEPAGTTPDISFRPNATVTEREEKLKAKIDSHLSTWANQQPGDTGENKKQANKELKGAFGSRSELEENELKRLLAYVNQKYPTHSYADANGRK